MVKTEDKLAAARFINNILKDCFVPHNVHYWIEQLRTCTLEHRQLARNQKRDKSSLIPVGEAAAKRDKIARIIRSFSNQPDIPITLSNNTDAYSVSNESIDIT